MHEMERPQTASDNISIKSGIPIMSKGKQSSITNSESSCRSAIPRLQTRIAQQSEQNKQNCLRSKSFDERTAPRAFEMMSQGVKYQIKKPMSNIHLEDHIARAKRSGGASPRGSSLPRYALDAHRRSTSLSKSTPNATSPSETCIRLKQLSTTTTTALVQRKKNVARTSQVVSQSTFIAKKKKLEQLKTELQAKQKQVMEAYSSILETKKLIEEKTGKTVNIDNLEIMKIEKEAESEKPKIDIDFVQQMEQKLTQIPTTYQALCESLLENRSDIIHWLSMQHACKNHVVSKQLDTYKKEAEKYRQLVFECNTTQRAIVSELLENWKTLWEWKETCINERFTELETENRNVKDMVNDLTSELEKFRSAKADLEKKLNEAENNLTILKKKIEEKEKDLENMDIKSKHIEKQTICSYEAKLKLRKQKQKEMESKIKALEQKVESLNALNKKMDEELKNRGNTFDTKTKDLLKSSKLNEALVAKLEKERIGLDMRIKDLQQLLDSREMDYENNLKEYKSSIQSFESKIIQMQKEIDSYEKKYSDVRNELVKLQIKCHQDNEIMKKRKFATEPGGPGIHTQAEMDMWTELQSTRVALKTAEEKLQRNNEERDRFLQTIEKAVAEKDQLSSEGWTAKLVLKDREIEDLKHQVEQLSETIVHSRDLSAKQEKKISDMKKALDSLVANDSAAAADAAAAVAANTNKKETDPCSLEMKAELEKEHKKTHEMEEKLRESETKMRQMQTKIKELEKMLKVRDGLIGVLKSKKDMTLIEHDELRMYVNELLQQYNELNSKYEEKSSEINDLRTSIECKTMQIERLEKTVKSMEDLCQQTHKTNLELQERIKSYQKQLEEYQMSVVRPTSDTKGTVGIFYKPTEGNSYMLASPPI